MTTSDKIENTPAVSARSPISILAMLASKTIALNRIIRASRTVPSPASPFLAMAAKQPDQEGHHPEKYTPRSNLAHAETTCHSGKDARPHAHAPPEKHRPKPSRVEVQYLNSRSRGVPHPF